MANSSNEIARDINRSAYNAVLLGEPTFKEFQAYVVGREASMQKPAGSVFAAPPDGGSNPDKRSYDDVLRTIEAEIRDSDKVLQAASQAGSRALLAVEMTEPKVIVPDHVPHDWQQERAPVTV